MPDGERVWESEEDDDEDEDKDDLGKAQEQRQRRRGRQQLLQNSRVAATVSRQGRVELWALGGGPFSGGNMLLWRSTEEEGGPYLDDDLSDYEYVLSLSGKDGNLVLRSVARQQQQQQEEEEGEKGEEEKEEEECIWGLMKKAGSKLKDVVAERWQQQQQQQHHKMKEEKQHGRK
eukprot:evm.model.NODE_499_length_36058_cov_18.539797.4